MEREVLYEKVYDRAKELDILGGMDKISIMMDLESADLKFNLRLEELLEADNFNFSHDVAGISNNIVRDTFPSTNFGFFVPRFAGRV